MFEKTEQEINASITLEIKLGKVLVYPILFKRLFTNLIQNAIKYRSKEPLKIHITAHEENNLIILKVVDNGIGIDKSMHEEIFKIFKTIKPNEESTGIGLSVCKKIAELHHGKIEVESELGKGTSFKIEIPKL